ncbi:MAG: DUF3429 domain-containing protein [Rhizobiaceae bacterium]|nr:DUF3429 domain-containing protein [Rhizobiaceae bacterium]
MAEPEKPEEIQAREQTSPQTVARRLGYAGLVPAIVLSLWLYGIPVDHLWRETTIALLTGYAAVVLSFLGGIRWGYAMADTGDDTARLLAISVVPALGGWAAFFIPPPYSFVILAVAFAAHGAWDSLSAQSGNMPGWFARLRMQLTAGIVLTMIVAFAATATS